jgi:hypothetical protein
MRFPSKHISGKSNILSFLKRNIFEIFILLSAKLLFLTKLCYSRSVLLICLKPKRYNIGHFTPTLLDTQAGQPGGQDAPVHMCLTSMMIQLKTTFLSLITINAACDIPVLYVLKNWCFYSRH